MYKSLSGSRNVGRKQQSYLPAEQLYRVLKLQKRAAGVILYYADRQASSVALFNKRSWIQFYEQSRIDKCSIIYKRINGTLPIYLNDYIIINNSHHARNTRYPAMF